MVVYIVIGTQTGSSEFLGHSIAFQLLRHGICAEVSAANTISLGSLLLEDARVVFVLSTAAFGMQPHCIQDLVDEIKSAQNLSQLNYTIFGLGDSKYPRFNWAARSLVAKLESRNANAIYPPGYGDEQHPIGVHGEFISWFPGLLEVLGADLNCDDNLDSWLPEVSLHVQVHDHGKPKKSLKTLGNFKKIATGLLPSRNKVEVATVMENDIITHPDHFRPVRQLTLSTILPWSTGDVACIYPRISAPPSDVLDPNLIVELLPNDSPSALHGSLYRAAVASGNGSHVACEGFAYKPTKVSDLFENILTLEHTCQQWHFYILAHFCGDAMQRDKLLQMSSLTVEGTIEYQRYCFGPRRNILEVLHDFNAVQLPMEWLINMALPIYPRLYSIASISGAMLKPTGNFYCLGWFQYRDVAWQWRQFKSLEAVQDTSARSVSLVKLLVVENETAADPKGRRTVRGLASRFFETLKPGDGIKLEIKAAPLEIIETLLNISRPVLLVSTGTGLAATLPILEHRLVKHICTFKTTGKRAGCKDMALFGFRRPFQDGLYATPNLHAIAPFCHVELVYSRVHGHKVYVQDVLVLPRLQERVWNILKDGLVFIAGKSHPMPRDVLQAMQMVVQQQAGFGPQAATKYINQAIDAHKIIIDSWG